MPSGASNNPDRQLSLIIGTIAIVIFALLAIALSLSTRQDLLDTREDYYVVSYYTNIGLLQKGAPVKYGGVQIGRVTSVDLMKDQRIRVESDITMPNPIPTNSMLSVAATTVSGDTFLNLILGDSSTNLVHADTPDDAPVVKGLNFIDISSLGCIFTDMKDITTTLYSNISRLFSKDSFTLTQAKEAFNMVPTLRKSFAELNKEIDNIKPKITEVTAQILKIKKETECCTKKLFSILPLEKIKSDIATIGKSFNQINDAISAVTKSESFSKVKDDLSTINTWADSLKIADNSIIGILLSDDCGGAKQTIKLVGESVKTAEDFSLFKKLGFYLDGRELLANFEERTHAEYLPASSYMYRWSIFSFERYLHDCDLPSGAKCCTPNLR